jgi:hypothetical protein
MHSVRTGFGIPSVNRYVDVSTSNFCGLKFRSNVVVLPTNKNIKLTSVGFVRFTWLEKNDDQGDQEVSDDSDDDSKADGKELTYEELAATIRPVEQGKRYTHPRQSGSVSYRKLSAPISPTSLPRRSSASLNSTTSTVSTWLSVNLLPGPHVVQAQRSSARSLTRTPQGSDRQRFDPSQLAHCRSQN